MKKTLQILCVAALAVATFTLTGCATSHHTTTTKVENGVTNTIVQADEMYDALRDKVVVQEDTFYGLNADVIGNSYVTPFKIKCGFGRTIWRSLPTSTAGVVATAPYNASAHGNASIINQTADESVSTTTNLTSYAPVSASVFNPVTGSYGSSPVVGMDRKGNPIIVTTNGVVK